MEIRLSELVGRGFWGSHRAIRSGCNELIEAGGRGSGKSSFLSIELLLQLLKHPACHGVVLRKVASTLRTSVYAQLLWAIGALGLTEYFRCSLSPLECEYLPTGQKILFFGMDDAGKLKSLKMPRGYIGIAWFEELDQFDAEEVRSAEQSLFRGGEFSLSLKSFNPPGSEKHWANRYFLEEKVGRFAHKSTYLELPPEWLGERFLGDAEHLKRVNPALYALEYLGIPIGSGEEVFPNLVLVGTETLSSRVERSEIEGSTHYDGAKIPRLPSVARDDRVVGRTGGVTSSVTPNGVPPFRLRCPAAAAPVKAGLHLADRGAHYACASSATGSAQARGLKEKALPSQSASLTARLRAGSVGGSDSPPDCHSLPPTALRLPPEGERDLSRWERCLADSKTERVEGRLGGRPMVAPTGVGKALPSQSPAATAPPEGERGFPKGAWRLPKASGVDWGWWPDPWAFNRVAYDAENRVLYILSELHCYRTGNRETGLMVKNIIPSGEVVIADSAEPKSVGDYRQLGLCCRSAKKGPGSVAYGIKWLQSLAAIVIDPEICPETAREFAACRYVDGKIPGGNDHHIDAVRYASQVFWRN